MIGHETIRKKIEPVGNEVRVKGVDYLSSEIGVHEEVLPFSRRTDGNREDLLCILIKCPGQTDVFSLFQTHFRRTNLRIGQKAK
jgi:hypothetical protein